MKKLITICLLAFFMTGMLLNAQEQPKIKREGNTFSVISTSHSSDTIKTVFLYKDSQENIYPIWFNKSTGSCFVFKTSQKTGKQYRYYLSDEIRKNVCDYYNIPFTPRKKN